ncbi:MAG: FAD-binding oxidoreductase [Deltaproteobacteria bacterium]|nr:FAD-binding oxidoreductase [Deltaproteobacteria bacterium]
MADLLKEIINVVGDDNAISQSPELERYAIEGKTPKVVVLPQTIEEISEILKVASSKSLAVIPRGGGTKIGFGREPNRADIVLCMSQLNQVLEHEASDLVAATQCGITLKAFQGVLKEKNQFLAIDPPHFESGATVGGIIATNDSGPRRLRYGTMRELLIGIRVVRSDGAIVKGGAKVVKNVAGYDIPKLYVGSLGTLGIIVEGIFRLYPIPELSQTYIVSFSNLAELQKMVLSILNSSLVPTCLEVLNPTLIDAISDQLRLNLKKEKYALAIRIESVGKAVRDQVSKVKGICGERGGEGILVEGVVEESFWQEIREFPWSMSVSNRVICKAGVLITDVPRVFQALGELSSNSGLGIYSSARAGNGILIISIEGEMSPIIEATKSLRNLVNSLKGNLIIRDAPADLKSQVDVWGEVGESIKVMERLKSHFDPNGILNPGRFVGEI